MSLKKYLTEMKSTDHAVAKDGLDRLAYKLDLIIELFGNDLPPALDGLLPSFVELRKKVEAFDISHLKAPRQQLEGKILTRAQVKAMLPAYDTPWVFGHFDDEDEEGEDLAGELDNVRDRFGIDLTGDKLKRYPFHREYENRSELNYVCFYCIPGHARYDAATDRADGGIEWVKNEELKSRLDRE